MTRILVLGAGELGISILQALATHPAHPDISVLLRPSTSSTRQSLLNTLTSLSVSTIIADVGASDLSSHLRDYDIVISAVGFSAGPGIQTHICQAVLDARVPYFIPWQFGVDYDAIGRGSSQPLFDEQLDVRDMLRKQDTVKWTIISTGIFTSFLFHPAFGVVVKDEDKPGSVVVNALGDWGNKVTMTTVEDIGKLTADIVLHKQIGDVQSGVEYVAGDTVTFGDLADVLGEAGWKVDRRLTDVEELAQARAERPDDLGPKYQLIWARNIGVSWDMDQTWNWRKGLRTVDVRTWIEGNFKPSEE